MGWLAGAGLAAWAVAALALRGPLGLLARLPFALLVLALERLMPDALPRPLPRSPADLLVAPARLVALLRGAGRLPPAAVAVAARPLAGIETEPDKNATSAAIRLVWTPGPDAAAQEMDVFVKCQSGRGMPLWLQAVRLAAEPGVAREADFYTRVAEHVPLSTPKCLTAQKLTALNLVCIVMEHLPIARKDATVGPADLRVTPDHLFRSVPDLRLMLTKVACMHAQFLGVVATHPASSWIPARRGLDFCEWAMGLAPPAAKKRDGFVPLFDALRHHFRSKALTVVHGDCRPGNMIFRGPCGSASEVIFADWEATNAAPPVWDFVYATVIGMEPEARAASHDDLLAAYHQALVQATPEGVCPEPLPVFRDDAMLLTMVLFYVSYTVTTGGFWRNQGNTNNDLESWGRRLLAAVQAVDTDRAARLLNIPSAEIASVKQLASEWATDTAAAVSE